jgi:hypothetical protein
MVIVPSEKLVMLSRRGSGKDRLQLGLLSDVANVGQASEVSQVVLGSGNRLDSSRAMEYSEILVCEQITSFWILNYVRWRSIQIKPYYLFPTLTRSRSRLHR